MTTVSTPALIGTVCGAVLGFAIGGSVGAVAIGEMGAGIGTKFGIWEWGANTIDGITRQAVDKVLLVAEKTAQCLFTGGLITFAYLGASKSMQESCAINSQHQMCQIFPYINFGVLILGVAAITAVIGKSIFNINHNQNSIPQSNAQDLQPKAQASQHSPRKKMCSTYTTCNPPKTELQIGSSHSEISFNGVKIYS